MKKGQARKKDQLLLPLPIKEEEEDAFPEDLNQIAESKAFVLVIYEGVPSIHVSCFRLSTLETSDLVSFDFILSHLFCPKTLVASD